MNEAKIIYEYLNQRIPGIEVFVGYGSEFDKNEKELEEKKVERKIDKFYNFDSLIAPIRVLEEIKWKKNEDQYDCLILCQDVKESFSRGLESFPECCTYGVKHYTESNDSEKMTSYTNVVYMTYVYIEPLRRYIKIGFCDYKKTLISMANFDSQYIPFRLLKKIYLPKSTVVFDDTLRLSRTMFDITAGFLTPEMEYPLEKHFELIYGSSYNGDHRNGAFEDTNKVNKLLHNHAFYIDSQYGHAIYERKLCDGKWYVCKKIPAGWFSFIPGGYRQAVIEAGLQYSTLNSYEERAELASVLNECIGKRNKIESAVQPIRGAFSTGIINTAAYGLRKIGKAQGKK